jgi:hypothetical protein
MAGAPAPPAVAKDKKELVPSCSEVGSKMEKRMKVAPSQKEAPPLFRTAVVERATSQAGGRAQAVSKGDLPFPVAEKENTAHHLLEMSMMRLYLLTTEEVGDCQSGPAKDKVTCTISLHSEIRANSKKGEVLWSNHSQTQIQAPSPKEALRTFYKKAGHMEVELLKDGIFRALSAP